MKNALSIDLEEYFHPTEVQSGKGMEGWSACATRLDFQTEKILELLDRHRTSATFFVLGWVAERHSRLIRQIAESGHEIACHSYAHSLIYNLSPAQFRCDTEKAIGAIGSACGVRPRAYRAPSYSITARSLWALDILVECGFTHDSSIYPINHDRYGIPGFQRHAHLVLTKSGPIYEVPIATARLSPKTITPVGGGAYLRLLPYRYTAAGIRRINRVDQTPACIYFHPWEIDPNVPRLTSGVVARLRTYSGLSGMQRKLDRLLMDFEFSSLASVYPLPTAVTP